MSKNRNRVVAALCAAAVAGGGAGAGAVALSHRSGSSGSPAAAVATPSGAANTASGSALSVAQIAKQSTKSVVEVDATSTNNQSPYPGSSSESAAEGTGFVYDTNGHIVTNEHVVDGSSTVRVKLSDGSTYKATVVGTDISSDIAVLHIDAPASKLTPLALGDSNAVAVGDGVVAIGNPFGLDGTVTSGIVSAVGREISAPDGAPIEGAIQTDAAINHGNSGGPLFDLAGKVIGITSQIQSDSGGNDGIGFAVPSNTVKNIADQLIANGSVKHALLGVTIGTTANGVAVSKVESGTGADHAGIKSGDVITAVNGTAVSSATRLRAIIDAHSPGDTLTLVVKRSGETKTFKVTLGTRTS
jgi:putative serine protease PepD